jgi:hypothetical protein
MLMIGCFRDVAQAAMGETEDYVTRWRRLSLHCMAQPNNLPALWQLLSLPNF